MLHSDIRISGHQIMIIGFNSLQNIRKDYYVNVNRIGIYKHL